MTRYTPEDRAARIAFNNRVRMAMTRRGVTAADLARALAKSAAWIKKCLADDGTASFRAWEYRKLNVLLGCDLLADDAASLGMSLQPLMTSPQSAADVIGAAALAGRESAEAVAATMGALADGRITPSESATCDAQDREAHQALAELSARRKAATI